MKQCPENDKILLFCERELSDMERAEFELHLKTCEECQRELEQINSDDALLKEGVEEAFTRHRVADRIMKQIRHEQIAAPTTATNSRWRWFWLTAFALIAAMAVVSLYTPTDMKYHRREQAVMLQALNDKATLQNEKLAVDQIFSLEALEPVKLDGCFLFTVTDKQTSVFKMSGRATARLNKGLPEFSDSEARFELISGTIITILINGNPVKLARKSITPAPFNTSDLKPGHMFLPDRNCHPIISTTDAGNGIINDSASDTSLLIESPAANISTASVSAEVVPGTDTWVDPTQAPAQNPFADEPLRLNGN